MTDKYLIDRWDGTTTDEDQTLGESKRVRTDTKRSEPKPGEKISDAVSKNLILAEANTQVGMALTRLTEDEPCHTGLSAECIRMIYIPAGYCCVGGITGRWLP